jgi:hypothetical protein
MDDGHLSNNSKLKIKIKIVQELLNFGGKFLALKYINKSKHQIFCNKIEFPITKRLIIIINK